jgi:hypothetical protein
MRLAVPIAHNESASHRDFGFDAAASSSLSS